MTLCLVIMAYLLYRRNSGMSNPPENENNLKFPIEVYRGFDSQAETKNRQKFILKLKYDLLRQGIVPDELILVKELEKFGYYLDIPSLRSDMATINIKNNFVRDLVLCNYSNDVEFLMCNLHGVIRNCNEILEKKWTANKIISSEEQNAKGTIVKKQRVVTDEVSSPKIQATKVKLDAINKLAAIYSGGVIDAAIALAQEEADKFAAEMKKLKLRNEELEKANASLQNEKNNPASTDDAVAKTPTDGAAAIPPSNKNMTDLNELLNRINTPTVSTSEKNES